MLCDASKALSVSFAATSPNGRGRGASPKHKKRLEWLGFPVIQPLSVGCFLLWGYYNIGFTQMQDGRLHFVISYIFRYRILGRTYKTAWPMGARSLSLSVAWNTGIIRIGRSDQARWLFLFRIRPMVAETIATDSYTAPPIENTKQL